MTWLATQYIHVYQSNDLGKRYPSTGELPSRNAEELRLVGTKFVQNYLPMPG